MPDDLETRLTGHHENSDSTGVPARVEREPQKHDVLSNDDFALLRKWARQMDGMRQVFNDDRAFQCEAVSSLLMSITTKR